MGSTTMTLAQLALTGAQNLNPLALEVMRRTTLDQFTGELPAKPISGVNNVFRRRGSETILQVNNRDIGTSSAITEGYATANIVTDTCGRVIGQPSMDTIVEAAHNLVNPWVDQVNAYIPVLQDKIANNIINGSGSGGQMSGLKKIANAIGSTQQYTPNTTTTGNNIQFVHLDKLALRVRGARKAFIMNPNLAIDLKQLGTALGGVTWGSVMVPYASVNADGYIEIQQRPVQAFNGIPIFESEWMTTETTCGKSGKYRVFCISLDEGTGVELFYPNTLPALGLQVYQPEVKESYPEKFMRFEWIAGISARGPQSIAQGFNFKLTYAS